jgi:hypothetical protein
MEKREDDEWVPYVGCIKSDEGFCCSNKYKKDLKNEESPPNSKVGALI